MKKTISKDGAQIVAGLRPLAVSIGRLRSDPKNARRHPDRNLEAVKASLARYGQRKPIVVNKRTGFIEAGNATWEAAKALGWQTLAAVYVQDDPRTAVGYAIADNRTAELAEWDDAALLKILQTLKLDGELAHVGFDDGELDKLLRELQPPKEETFNVAQAMAAAPELAERVKRGQVWGLGRHRLMCGDSTKAEDVARFMGGGVVEMVFTDPPWNVAIGQDSNPRHRQRPGLVNDDLSEGDYANFLGAFADILIRHLSGDLYCVLGSERWPLLDATLRGAGFHWSATVIWVKDQFVLGRSKYHRRYEPIWYGWHKDRRSSYVAGRDEDDVWEIPRPHASDEHPTMKPVELVRRAVVNSSGRGNVVFDPFLGAGSTLIAAVQTDRICYGVEIEPRYCAVAIARWESYTGESAVLLDG